MTTTIQWDISPGFAAIYGLAAEFPAVNSLERFHLRIAPLGDGAQYWAMVSVTDNETQQVLFITPR